MLEPLNVATSGTFLHLFWHRDEIITWSSVHDVRLYKIIVNSEVVPRRLIIIKWAVTQQSEELCKG